jgi:hypothetical protein
MTWSAHQLAFDFGGNAGPGLQPGAGRREARESVARLVEHRPFPCVASDARWRTGVTRDLSGSGLCLRAERPEPAGSLQHVVVRRIDGRPAFESVARVVWCARSGEGAWWLGLALVARRSSEPVRVRRSERGAGHEPGNLARA